MKAVLLGTGWRAHFYMRISRMLPDILSIPAVLTRKKERAEEIEREGFRVFTDIDEVLAVDHDAIIISSGKEGYHETLSRLHAGGERIVSETTLLSLSDEELDKVSSFSGLVMEQYQFTPLFSSVLKVLSSLEEKPDQLYLSGLHNHHSASMARRILASGHHMPEEVSSITFPSRIIKTGTRKGLDLSGEVESYERSVRMMKLDGALFIHDFSSNQYHSYLMEKRFEIRCQDMIITERGVSTVDGSGYPVFTPFQFHRDDRVGNGTLALSHVSLGDRTVFVNPYYPLNMNDDEIAMTMMIESFDKGNDLYPFREGVMDARIGKLL